jgi:hypothetical protein
MTSTEIKSMQDRLKQAGFYQGSIDGFWGPMSQNACRQWARSLMPKVNPWPYSDQASLRAFYGQPGDERNLVTITFPYPMYYGGKLVKTTRVHKKCADSLLRVLKEIGASHGHKPDVMDEASDYGGVFNFRLKRGGSSYSLHAFGAAIDLDADDNTFKDSWPMKADMNLDVIAAFSREGWKSAAVFWGYDAMHFECTR